MLGVGASVARSAAAGALGLAAGCQLLSGADSLVVSGAGGDNAQSSSSQIPDVGPGPGTGGAAGKGGAAGQGGAAGAGGGAVVFNASVLGTGAANAVYPLALATDGNKILVGGSIVGAAQFGGTEVMASGGEDALVAIYDRDMGSWTAARSSGDAGTQRVFAVGGDAVPGRLLAGGAFIGSVFSATSPAMPAGFAASIPYALGAEVWSLGVVPSGGSSGNAAVLAATMTPADALWLAGFTDQTKTSFGGQDMTIPYEPPSATKTAFAARLGSWMSGTPVYQCAAFAIGTVMGNDCVARAVVAGGSTDVFVGGSARQAAQFFGFQSPGMGGRDGFVLRTQDTQCGPLGAPIRLGGTGDDDVLAIARRNDGVVVGGQFRSKDFNYGGLVGTGGYDGFVVSFDAAFMHKWTVGLHKGDNADDKQDHRISAVAVLGGGDVVVAGTFGGAKATLGASTLTASGDGPHAFVARLQGDKGELVWARVFVAEVGAGFNDADVSDDPLGAPPPPAWPRLAVLPDDTVVFAAGFEGDVTLDGELVASGKGPSLLLVGLDTTP
jgi:hypothetical protein